MDEGGPMSFSPPLRRFTLLFPIFAAAATTGVALAEPVPLRGSKRPETPPVAPVAPTKPLPASGCEGVPSTGRVAWQAFVSRPVYKLGLALQPQSDPCAPKFSVDEGKTGYVATFMPFWPTYLPRTPNDAGLMLNLMRAPKTNVGAPGTILVESASGTRAQDGIQTFTVPPVAVVGGKVAPGTKLAGAFDLRVTFTPTGKPPVTTYWRLTSSAVLATSPRDDSSFDTKLLFCGMHPCT